MVSATDSARPETGGRTFSLRWKMLLAFGLVGLVGVATVALLANQAAVREVRGFMFQGGMTDTGLLADELAEYYRDRRSWDGVDLLLGTRGSGSGFGNHQGMAGLMSPRLRLAAPDGTVLVGEQAGGSPLTAGELGLGTPIVVDGETVGILLVEGSGTMGPTAEVLGRLNRGFTVAALAAGAAALAVGWALAAGLIRPVRRLTAAAQAIARGELEQRVPVRGRDELAALAGAFNEMADSLERAERLRRDMTADVAHELRNPLAILRAQVEALSDGVYPLTVENLAPILGQTQVLSRLVEDLRTLALADSGQLRMEPAATDLYQLSAIALEAVRAQADASQIGLQLRGGPALAMIDRLRTEQALGNLLSNALRHTPAGGTVAIEVGRGDDPRQVLLAVEDSGEGIPEAAIPFVFERFYRGDRARSRADGGTGLGLAITRQLVLAQGGSIIAGNRPGGGARFSLVLPAAG